MLLFLKQKKKIVKKEEQERSTMVALLSHRLRTPLTAVRWGTGLLLDQGFGKLQISQMEVLNKIRISVTDAIGVLNTFLEASRIERGSIDTTPLALDVLEYLPRLMSTYESLLEEKKQIIELPKHEGRVLVCMNPLILHTIVEVIVHNALLYSPEGSTIKINVDDTDAHHVMVSITDSGIGISPEDMKKLFTKFFRSHEALIVSTTGNGLGLYFVKNMLDTIGGTISCTSELHKGSTFTMGLPKA